MQNWIKILFYALVLFFVSSCAGISYYSQAVQGQLALLTAREPVEKLLDDPTTPESLKRQLEKTREILIFAENNGLPVGKSYGTYVDLQRPFVVWNVFAAPSDQVSLVQHCFPIAGCVGYKGYFAETDAEAFAKELQASGYDVFVGGVAAYSTLGWFDDPLLNTFIYREDARLAAVLFHELAHKVLYVEGDTVFNESFATAVERHLLETWLATRGLDLAFTAYLDSEQRRAQVIDLILQTRDKLAVVYGPDVEVEGIETEDLGLEEMDTKKLNAEKAKEKARLIAQLKMDYRELQERWEAGTEFSTWIEQDLNNAHLAAIGAYQSEVPAFMGMLNNSTSLDDFFDLARRIGELPKAERDMALAEHRYTD